MSEEELERIVLEGCERRKAREREEAGEDVDLDDDDPGDWRLRSVE